MPDSVEIQKACHGFAKACARDLQRCDADVKRMALLKDELEAVLGKLHESTRAAQSCASKAEDCAVILKREVIGIEQLRRDTDMMRDQMSGFDSRLCDGIAKEFGRLLSKIYCLDEDTPSDGVSPLITHPEARLNANFQHLNRGLKSLATDLLMLRSNVVLRDGFASELQRIGNEVAVRNPASPAASLVKLDGGDLASTLRSRFCSVDAQIELLKSELAELRSVVKQSAEVAPNAASDAGKDVVLMTAIDSIGRRVRGLVAVMLIVVLVIGYLVARGNGP